jgi:hypothetical protein
MTAYTKDGREIDLTGLEAGEAAARLIAQGVRRGDLLRTEHVVALPSGAKTVQADFRGPRPIVGELEEGGS